MKVKTKQQRVLVVDDNEPMAKCLAEMVDIYGVPCDTAKDGEEAIELLKRDNYALIIADSNMPRISGFTLLKYVRKYYPNLKVAIISIRDSDVTQNMVVRDMPDYYLPKPFKTKDIEELLANIE